MQSLHGYGSSFSYQSLYLVVNCFQYSHLYRGVYPFYFPEQRPDFSVEIWQEDVDRRLKWGISHGIRLGIINLGDSVVCVQGWRGGMGHTNTIRVVPAQDNLGLNLGLNSRD